MKKNLMFLALAAVGLASCNGGFKKGDNGLLYNIHIDKSGPKLKVGDFVSVNLILKNDGDSVLYSTYQTGHAIPMVLPKPQFKGDIFDGMQLLAEGDSATIKVIADSAFKKTPKPAGFKGKYVVYNIKIDKVIAKGTQTDQVFQGAVTDYIKAQGDIAKNQEPAKIQKYITDSKLKFNKTATGLYYIITKPGTGPMPANGDTVAVNYTGKLVNGKVFDTDIKQDAIKNKIFNPSNPYMPLRIPVGQQHVIAGWDEGLLLLNKGAKAIFIVPSSLAYADRGNSAIGPFTPLVFEIELVNFTKSNPNAQNKVIVPPMQQAQPVKK